MKRRLFLGGLLVGTAAPAIVRASSLMRIYVPRPSDEILLPIWLTMSDEERLRAKMLRAVLDEIEREINPVIGIDHAEPGSERTALYRVEYGVIERFTIYTTPQGLKPWR